ncbi:MULTISPECIES: sterol desaturase family protein [Aphanothece]|uniref:sterol desaturase family protein n=1 Tax=Aphanothece TaxID=1121 RepID=UPI0039847A4C
MAFSPAVESAVHWLQGLLLALLSWTGLAYGVHRLAHHRASWNWLEVCHRHHHRPRYLLEARPLRWHHLLFWFDTLAESVDVWITLTLPALLIAALLPAQGPVLLGLHYFYEVLFSDARLDHNPRIQGRITRVLAWGTYHLEHHRNPRCHYGLIVTLWDVVFGSTSRLLPPDAQAVGRMTPRRDGDAPS